MNFRNVKQGIIDLLGAASGGQYTVVGYQRQTKAGDLYENGGRIAQVFHRDTEFPQSSGTMRGPLTSVVNYNIEVTVAARSELDLDKLNDADNASTEAQAQQLRREAMDAFVESAKRADDAWDEFVDLLWNVLMDARNYDLNQDKGIVADRWVNNIRKDDMTPQGENVLLSGIMEFSVRVKEVPSGETPKEGDLIDLGIKIRDDDVGRSGIIE